MAHSPPQDDSRREPLESDSGSIERKSVGLRRIRKRYQLLNAAAPEHGDSDGEHDQDNCEVPVHRESLAHSVLFSADVDGCVEAAHRPIFLDAVTRRETLERQR